MNTSPIPRCRACPSPFAGRTFELPCGTEAMPRIDEECPGPVTVPLASIVERVSGYNEFPVSDAYPETWASCPKDRPVLPPTLLFVEQPHNRA